MKKSRLLGTICACVFTLVMFKSANATIVTLDPGAFPNDTDLTNAYSGVTLSADVPDVPGSIVTNNSIPFEPSQFTMSFSGSSGDDDVWTDYLGFVRTFQVDFATLTDFVSVDMRYGSLISFEASSGVIEAYDSGGALLDSIVVNLASNSTYQTLSIIRGTADIAFIRAYGTGSHPFSGANISLVTYNAAPLPPVIDPSATIADDAMIGDGSTVGANTVIKRGVIIGTNSSIGANVTINKDVTLGDSAVVGDGSTIHKDVIAGDDLTVGTNVTIHKDVVIGANVTIGDNSQIHSDTVIGSSVVIGIIGSGVGVFVGNRVTIPNGTVIADGEVIPNDTIVGP